MSVGTHVERLWITQQRSVFAQVTLSVPDLDPVDYRAVGVARWVVQT